MSWGNSWLRSTITIMILRVIIMIVRKRRIIGIVIRRDMEMTISNSSHNSSRDRERDIDNEI